MTGKLVRKHPKYQQAVTYAWGRQDAGDDSVDTQAAYEFGRLYALRAIAFEEERSSNVPILCAAYQEWRETGAITDGWHAPRVRALPALTDEVLLATAAVAFEAAHHYAPPLRFNDLLPNAQDHWINVVTEVVTHYAKASGAEVSRQRVTP